jgi:hypothetical protein
MWGALEPVVSRIGSNARALVVPDFVDPGHLFEPFEGQVLLTVKIRQPSHEFTFGVGMTFVSYSLVLTPVV